MGRALGRRLAAVAVSLLLLPHVSLAADLKEIARDLKRSMPSHPVSAIVDCDDPYEALRSEPPDNEFERMAGVYRWNLDGSKSRFEKFFVHTNKDGTRDDVSVGYLEVGSDHFYYKYFANKTVPVTVQLISNVLPVPTPSLAYLSRGRPYHAMVSEGQGVTVEDSGPNLAVVKGSDKGLPFTLTMEKFAGRWRVVRIVQPISIQSQGRSFTTDVTWGGPRGLPKKIVRKQDSESSTIPSLARSATTISASEDAEPLKVTDRVLPGALVVVDGKVQAMGPDGELVAAVVPEGGGVSGWGMLYVASAAGMVFFSSVLLVDRLRRRPKKRLR